MCCPFGDKRRWYFGKDVCDFWHKMHDLNKAVLMETKKIENINISIIISVYNTEQYVARCINSILGQNIDNYEIIVVDDCSTDHSYEILTLFSENYKQIKLYRNKKNMGAGYTKNRALNLCQGKYICFVDSDDWILNGCLEKLYALAETMQCDDVFYGMISVNENDDIVAGIDETGEDILVEQIYDKGIDLFEKMLDEKHVTVAAGHHFFRRSILNEKISFSENTVNDDWCFTAMLYNVLGKTIVIKNRYYVYFHRKSGSITKKANEISLISEIYNHAVKIYFESSNTGEIYKRVREKCFTYKMIEIQNESVVKKVGWEKDLDNVQKYVAQTPELRKMFERSKFLSMYGDIDTNMIQKLRNKKIIYIYGAGAYGRDARRIIEANGIEVKAFIVTNKEKEMNIGFPILSIDEVIDTENSFWVLAVSDKYKKEVTDMIKKKGVYEYGYLIK